MTRATITLAALGVGHINLREPAQLAAFANQIGADR